MCMVQSLVYSVLVGSYPCAGLGRTPTSSSLEALGLGTFATPATCTSRTLSLFTSSMATPITSSRMPADVPGRSPPTQPTLAVAPKASDTVVVGPGSIVELMQEEKFVDFGQFPPARTPFGKGHATTMLSNPEGCVVLLQAADNLQTRNLIHDLATWMQCFAIIYAAVLTTKHPNRAQFLHMYATMISLLSKKSSGRRGWPMLKHLDVRQRIQGSQTGPRSIAASMPPSSREPHRAQTAFVLTEL